MTDWGDGEMDELTVVCPVCDGDGEFITEDDVYTCYECGGKIMDRYDYDILYCEVVT